MVKRKEEFSFKELINIFIPKLWIIILVSFVFGFCMALYAQFIKPETYSSNTRIHIAKKVSNDMNMSVTDIDFATSYLETYVEVLSTQVFLDNVVADIKARHVDDPEYLTNKGWENISADSIGGYISATAGNEILSVKVTTGNPELSFEIATSVANVIGKGGILAYDAVNTKILEEADRPISHDNPKVFLNALIGVAVGAVLSIAVIFILDLLDITIHDKKKIEDNFDIPVLGVIPRYLFEEGGDKK